MTIYRITMDCGRSITFEDTTATVMEKMEEVFESKIYGLSEKIFINTDKILMIEVIEQEEKKKLIKEKKKI